MRWMHRDITPQNILLFEARPEQSQPIRAGLCDFGKLSNNSTGTDTVLATWNLLPPEITQGQSNKYSQSINLWMLALALTYM